MITKFSKHNLCLKQPPLYMKKFETLCQEITIKSLFGMKTYIIGLIISLAFGCSDPVEHPDFDSNNLLLVSEINYEWLDGAGKMGKSEGNAINLADDEKVIRKKVMRAVTDSGPTEPNQTPPEPIQNLFSLMEVVSEPDTLNFFKEKYL